MRYVSRYIYVVCMGGVNVDEIIVWNYFKFQTEARASWGLLLVLLLGWRDVLHTHSRKYKFCGQCLS